MTFLKSYDFQHALSVGLTVLIATLINWYLAYPEYWIVLVAFLMRETTPGTPLRQNLVFILTIITAILAARFLLISIKQPIILNIILGTLFVMSSFIVFINAAFTYQRQRYLVLMFASILLLFAVVSSEKHTLQVVITEVITGGTIGIFCSQFVFPIKLDKEFRRGIAPLLKALIDYSDTLIAAFIKQEHHSPILTEKKIQVEKALQTHYPVWVYELGFNPGLRSGFRFFLINLERVTEVLFSINYLISRGVELDIRGLDGALEISMLKNSELLSILEEYFNDNKFKKTDSDFTDDIVKLETALQNTVPSSLELLDLSSDYITLTAFVRDIKDMRQLLLQLVMALP